MKKENKGYKTFIACFVIAIITSFATAFLTTKFLASQSQGEYIEMCKNNVKPDEHGCCPGETYTDMGEEGYNCCPNSGGDCFPPIKAN